MTDVTSIPEATPERPKTSLLNLDERTQRRNKAEARFKMYGIIAIGIASHFRIGSADNSREWSDQFGVFKIAFGLFHTPIQTLHLRLQLGDTGLLHFDIV